MSEQPKDVEEKAETKTAIPELLRVSACKIDTRVGDVAHNFDQITSAFTEAIHEGATLVLMPELALTGYTLGDLLLNDQVQDNVNSSLIALKKVTENTETALIVGASLRHKNKLFNTAVVVASGKVQGVVPKSSLANYKEFHESRWFESGKNITDKEIIIGSDKVPFGTDILFDVAGVKVAIEICDDLCGGKQPSQKTALAGGEVICNLSASNEIIGKAKHRRQLVSAQSSSLACVYIYTSSGVEEASTETVFGGHRIIAEYGSIVVESALLERGNRRTSYNIDVDKLKNNRNKLAHADGQNNYRLIETSIVKNLPKLKTSSGIARQLEGSKFILELGAQGLATALKSSDMTKVVLGISGGIDSAVAAIIAKRALDILELPASNLHTVGMPASASTGKTQANATKLAEALGATHQIIPITDITNNILRSTGHDQSTQNVVFENAHARLRKLITLQISNQVDGIELCTSDLGEQFQGWATFGGDTQGGYAVLAGLPKSSARKLLLWAAGQPQYKQISKVLNNIASATVSPELTGNGEDLSQSTDELIGPEDLREFVLTQLLGEMSAPEQITSETVRNFVDKYTAETINRWIPKILDRFTRSQIKRDSQAAGPIYTTVGLSPRTTFRMPPVVRPEWRNKFIDRSKQDV